MSPVLRTSRIACVLAGTAGLLLKGRYAGPLDVLVASHGGNVSVSFAIYFMLAASALGDRLGGWLPAIGALAAVEAFEVTDGFGIMANTYDPLDLAANAAGVLVAWGVDRLLRRSAGRAGDARA